MSTHIQEKFSNLRKRLDQLGYRQPLGIESLPLVERLFADLLHTTESLKNTKLATSKSPREKADIEAQIEPYKNDNSRLVKENNELHAQLIRAREEADKVIAEFKATLRKLEHENNDLKFLNNQYVHKIRVIEKESKEKSDSILRLQEKNFNAVIQTPGGKKKHVPFRRQRLVLEATVPPSEISSVPSIPPRDDPFVADLLRVADNRISELEKKLELVTDKNISLEGKVATYVRQVEARDAEIERLGRVLDGGRPYDLVAVESRNKSNEKLISQLNIQIDYLQQKNRDLERRLDDAIKSETEARHQVAAADFEKSNLEMSLKEADRTARRLDQDRKTVIGVADKELGEAKVEITRAKKDLDKLEVELSQVKVENERLHEDKKKLSADILSYAADFERLENLVDKTQQDKKKLGIRINRLLQTEKDLVNELESLKRSKKVGVSAAKARNRSPNRFDQLLKNIEQERDYWKGEVERLQEIVTYKHLGLPGTRSPSASPLKRSYSAPRRSRSSSRNNQTAVRSTSITNDLEAALKMANDDVSYYKRKYEDLKEELSSSRLQHTPPSREKPSDDVKRILEEKDSLQNQLDRLSQDYQDMKHELKSLAAEKDKLSNLYEENKQELSKSRQTIVRNSSSSGLSLAGQHLLKQVEKERDEAFSDLQHLTSERDSLRERLQVATETQINERASHDNLIEELQSRVRRSYNEKTELESQVSSLRGRISQLEEEVRIQAARYNESSEECRLINSKANQIRILADESEKSLRDNQQRLEIKEHELQTLTIKYEELGARLIESDKTIANLRNEVMQLKTAVTSLDREKDHLQAALDDKTERLLRLDDECAAQEERANQLLRNNRDVARQLEHNDETLKLKDREIVNLRKQIDGFILELNQVSKARDDQVRENKLLEDDLTNMTAENQRLSTDIRELIDERTQLSDQIQQYVADVKRVEDVLAQKESERSQLLEQYRSLTAEAERYETQTTRLESETHNLRRDIQSKDQNMRRLQENIELMDRELQQTQISYHSLEGQVANQNRVIEALELKIRELEEERYSLERDFAASRDLSVRLDHNKDTLQRRLAAKELECERVSETVAELEREISALKDRTYSDRQEIISLEQLLASNREKEFQAHIAVQESSSEIQLMKDRLTLNDSKIESQSREIAQLRNRIHDLEADLERSRHQLTNERFEREKAAQELRRYMELSKSQNSRSGYVTSQLKSGMTTPVSQGTPTKLFSPSTSNRGLTPTPIRSLHSATEYGTGNIALDTKGASSSIT